jgi:hypothetical protein
MYVDMLCSWLGDRVSLVVRRRSLADSFGRPFGMAPGARGCGRGPWISDCRLLIADLRRRSDFTTEAQRHREKPGYHSVVAQFEIYS